jgi:hypothetical protein
MAIALQTGGLHHLAQHTAQMVVAVLCPPGVAALARCAVIACTARAVSWLAVAHWWTGGDEVSRWRRGRQWRVDWIRWGGNGPGGSERLRASARGWGSSRACWSEARRLGMDEIEGEEGGSSGLSSCGWQVARHVERGKNGAWAVARDVREGGELRQDPGPAGAGCGRWAAPRTSWCKAATGKERGERGGWPVGWPAGWAPSINEMRRAGERLAGGPSRNLIKFKTFQTVQT